MLELNYKRINGIEHRDGFFHTAGIYAGDLMWIKKDTDSIFPLQWRTADPKGIVLHHLCPHHTPAGRGRTKSRFRLGEESTCRAVRVNDRLRSSRYLNLKIVQC